MQRIGVVGAGVMGIGVAQSAAQSKFDVIVVDHDENALARARTEVRNNLRFHALMKLGVEVGEIDRIMARISFAVDARALEQVDFLIENVVEKWDVKKALYPRLDEICLPHCIFAANTSAIPITRIAAQTNRSDRVVGMHFMNPVPMKNTVEVIRGLHTSETTLAEASHFLQRMGKAAVVVNDSPGFVSNRVLMLIINEAISLVHERVAPAEDVDKIFESCFGHKMGPLATADLIGLDTILYSLEVLQDCFGDPKFRPSVLLKQMVDGGLHGKKSGRGFFEYKT